MRIKAFGVLSLVLLAAACGRDEEQRAASAGLSAAAVGAAAGGPAGAAIGGAAGAAAGSVLPEGADTLAMNALHRERPTTAGRLQDMIRQVQRKLHAQDRTMAQSTAFAARPQPSGA